MKIFIVHGYAAGPHDHWFRWLAAELLAAGHEAEVLALPDSLTPAREVWEGTLGAAIGSPDDRTVVVTHSLGTITALRWLAAQPAPARLRGLVMVAGFQGALEALPELDGYLAEGVDAVGLRPIIGTRVSIHSDDDPFVPPQQSHLLAVDLDAAEVEVHGAGHFLGADGHTELPQVLAAVLRVCDS